MSDLIATPKSMKNVILKGIRSGLLELGSATKVELSHKLGISFPTISKFLTQMEKDGELLVVGLDDSSGGRRAKRYSYNPEYMLGLAIFLESNETHYTVFNCMGEVKEQGNTSSVLKNKDLSLLTQCIQGIIEEYPRISSIAIGVPGSVDNGRIFYIPDYDHLQNFDLKGYYENHFSIPVVIENDMNAAVLGYYKSLGNTDNQSLVYLYFGQNGPGAGVLINGDVVRGRSFFSGEVSFVPQYEKQNFFQALENRTPFLDNHTLDAVSRLVATFVAIINPHMVIFCHGEVSEKVLEDIKKKSSTYVPSEHLPELTESNWKQDYLLGLQNLGLELMITQTSK
ncbi:ROK family protein [Robertmurraya korlensis]|uniref:ROK family transcriptional regulator n=1 Tax=Robertmurraya korlensis TaxID=519977 RepID=UPI00203EBA8F|nr:ROK family protein [Robertmurraya korlensis]MCM3600837.1 ROK family protein [Robertmurraya korlensis]